MRYKVIRSRHHAHPRHRLGRRETPQPVEAWDEANLWIEHDTIPDAELISGVVSGEIEDEIP